MTIIFLWPNLIHFAETMAYFLAEDPAIKVRVVTRFGVDDTSEHPWVLRRMREHGGIELLDISSAPPQPSDFLVFQLVRQGRMPKELAAWQAQSKASAFAPFNNHYSDGKDWAREWLRSFPSFLKAKAAIFERGWKSPVRDLRFGFQKHVHYAPFIHPNFLANPEWREAVFAPLEAETMRRFRIGFVGNRTPAERAARIAQCKGVLDGAAAEGRVALVGRDLEASAAAMQGVWVEYGNHESTGPRGLEPMEYMALLADMDFCISPPGWGLNWTHRTVEALVRGAIPVIEDPQLYSLGLCDGETCLLVKDNDWAEATRRALALPAAEVLWMRRKVLALRSVRLTLGKAAAKFRGDLLG